MLRFAKFEKFVDPDGVLPVAERAKRTENLRRAHLQRIALRSAKARRRREQAGKDGEDAEPIVELMDGE